MTTHHDDTHPLRKARKERSLTLDDLAKATGIPKTNLWRVETRKQDADLDVIRKTTAFFRPLLTADDFVADKGRAQ